jgi:hypothetical protein
VAGYADQIKDHFNNGTSTMACVATGLVLREFFSVVKTAVVFSSAAPVVAMRMSRSVPRSG